MIALYDKPHGYCLVLAPNRSASWHSNKCLLLIVGAVITAIAVGFAAIGAWMIVPFAGLEMLALGSALYWVNWQLHYRQVLWFDGQQLRIEKGHYGPRQQWCWSRRDTAVHVSEQALPGRPLNIHLSCGALSIPIGEFLSADDSQALLQTLQQLGLTTRGFSCAGDLAA